jgi:hypothetical protein
MGNSDIRDVPPIIISSDMENDFQFSELILNMKQISLFSLFWLLFSLLPVFSLSCVTFCFSLCFL